MKQTATEFLFEKLWETPKDKLTWNAILEQALKIERDNLIIFGAQCMIQVENESGLGSIKIYELYFNKKFNP
jgi:hypothetical protein